MTTRIKKNLTICILVLGLFGFLHSEELPKPTYDNSVIFSWTHYFLRDTAENINYIKSQFDGGLYTRLSFSTFVEVGMDWNIDITDSSNNIQAFKDKVDELVNFARTYSVGIHLTIMYGISRYVHNYDDAKIEDIRNAQWYNDNNISSSSQMRDSGAETQDSAPNTGLDLDNTVRGNKGLSSTSAATTVINKYVFTTPSRYARKLRAHLDAKVAAAFAYLKQQQDANPDILIIVSAPGESELNYHRINNSQHLQDFFCDYSPFTVMEFRDWIKHEGLYASGEKYDGEGYSGGGSRYQGGSGLSNFNSDFGTSFSSWDLKYYNWSLSDAVDSDYTDGSNPDPNIIPVSSYTYGSMKPSSGSNYISGGFDSPRVMKDKGTDDFYDLWHTFRETMMNNYVKDMAKIARDSGFAKKKYYSHQIPGDYLFNTRPNDPLIPTLNPRYYSSATPMWTAQHYSDMGFGVTLYDINYGTWYARTTKYGIAGAGSYSNNWAALEYNPDVIPEGVSASISPVATIYDQMIKLYNGNAHVIGFFKWKDKTEEGNVYRYAGNNRETAAKQFFDVIKDKGRQPISSMFTPKKVEGFSGSYNSTTGILSVSWSSKIWTGESFTWGDWGDFKEFVIYRGLTSDFTTDNSSEIVRKSSLYSSYIDTGYPLNTTVYYKIAAVNKNGEIGPTDTISIVTPETAPTAILSVSRDRFNFAFIMGGNTSPPQNFRITNNGGGALNWTASDDAEWLTCTPGSGTGNALVEISADASGLAIGTYTGTITVADPAAANSPQTITVYLTVKSSAQNQLPFGSFDTPKDGSTVRSSIPVTGWVLDDVGIQSLKIYRDPVAGEGSQLIYVGVASFVEGARPDIEDAFPDYPANYMAGWGYMMLTNFLPNGSSGPHTIYAIATDSFGYEVTLGSKTINCDNANAVKPFGAIDTPLQGGTAFGTKFVNWGWALTPMPNSIPTDGSTISVFIDGVNVGNPTYNLYREDIATFFPGYANSNGAVGYFILDTTQYSEGVHIIQWTATDFGGNTDGIGSRFFTIQNTGSSERSAQKTSQQPRGFAYHGPTERIPSDRSVPIHIKKGFNKNTRSQRHYPGKDGSISLSIRQLERVEIRFFGADSSASQLLNISELPIGSTLDSEQGVFYWSPTVVHFGRYSFDFAINSGPGGQMVKKTLNIKILPKNEK